MKWRECETAVDGLLRLGDGKVQGGVARVFVSMCRWMAQGAKTHSLIVQQGFNNFEATAVYTSAPKGPILPPSMYSFCYFHPVLLPARFGRQLTAHSVFLCAGPSFSGIDSGFGLKLYSLAVRAMRVPPCVRLVPPLMLPPRGERKYGVLSSVAVSDV